MTSSVQKSLSKADKYLKSGNFAAAGIVYQQILSKYPKNKKAIQAYQRLRSGMTSQPSSRDEVPTEKLRELVNIYKMEKYSAKRFYWNQKKLSKYIQDLQGF